jgi:hypothetical protein
MIKTKAHAIPASEPLHPEFIREITFSLGGLNAYFNSNTEELNIQVPAVTLEFDEIAKQLGKLGLENWEIEPLLDGFSRDIHIRVVSNLLAKRLR